MRPNWVVMDRNKIKGNRRSFDSPSLRSGSLRMTVLFLLQSFGAVTIAKAVPLQGEIPRGEL
jgi:hypothetical protein